MKKSKSGNNQGGYQKFGWKKSPKRKKSGGACNFGMIWKNSAYLPPPDEFTYYLHEILDTLIRNTD